MSNVVIDIITQFSGKKAFKEAETATAKLTNGVKKLAAAFGVGLGGAAVLRFARSSARAFIEDEKATSRLTQSVKNLGLAYATADISKYIDQLTLASGVADSQLRPALQSLLQVTGSVTKSQKMLNQAINISRGSGENLATVANDLAQAYVGNLKGLRKYNLGLTQAELKAASFYEIQDRLNGLFRGASAAYLKTYAGQMELLSNTASEAKEVIGKDLVDALVLVSGQDGVEGLAKDMSDLADYTGDAIYGIGVLFDKINNNKVVKLFGGLDINMIPILGGIVDNLVQLARSDKAAKNAFNFPSGGGAGAGSTASIEARQAAKAEAAAKKREQDRLKAEKAAAKLAKDQLALKKAGTLFDLEQTQILAALKGKITEDERKRLELQLAILTGNVSEASKLAYELAISQGLTEKLAKYIADFPSAGNPFSAWGEYLDKIEERLKKLNLVPPSGGGAIQPPVTTTADNLYQSIVDQGLARGESQATINSTLRYTAMGQAAQGQTPVVNVQVTLDGQEMVGAVSKVQTNNYLSGKIIALERTQSSFK